MAASMHRRRRTVLAFIGASAVALQLATLEPAGAQAAYIAIVIPPLPGGAAVRAAAINASGQVVGASMTSDGYWHPFLWQNGVTTDLGTLGGWWSEAYAINRAVQVIGGSITATGNWHAFVWQNGVLTDLGTLGGSWSWAAAIDEAGNVVGSSETTPGMWHAFLWKNGAMMDLGTLGGDYSWANRINRAGQVLGSADTLSMGHHPFLWQDGVMTDLFPGMSIDADTVAINKSGQVLGVGPSAFLWRNGVRTDLQSPDGSWSWASALNDAGQVVGHADTPAVCADTDGRVQPDYHAVLWENGTARVLGQAADCTPTSATGINRAGQIIGEIQTCEVDPYDNVFYCYRVSAFVHARGVTRNLNELTPGLALEHAAAINDCGQIAANGPTTAYRLDPSVCAPETLRSHFFGRSTPSRSCTVPRFPCLHGN